MVPAASSPPPRTWRRAMADALYGEGGFYRTSSPAAHFRTAPLATPLFADAVRALAADVDAALGRPDPFDVVDVGAGCGELLAALASGAPRRWRLTGVELRPGGQSVRWMSRVPACTGLLVANEWLDTVPCEVVERTPRGVRLVLEDDTLGASPGRPDLDWLSRWWPLAEGGRAEVGRYRDVAWAAAVRRVRRGVALAVDYGHCRAARPPAGTLAGYRRGRQVPPVADGSRDLTAHVALDACATAGEAATGRPALLTTQRDALPALGVAARPVPTYAGNPVDYLRALSAAGAAAELLAPGGFGDFGWLVQPVGVPVPARLADVRRWGTR